jgi:hypothetical protein
MAIVSALTNSFKAELLGGEHDFAAGGNTFKLALFVNATLGSTTTTYAAPADANAVPTDTNEVSDKTTNGGATATAYTAGGRTLTLSGVGTTTTTSFTSFADLSTANSNAWTSATFTTDGCMIYNTSGGSANKVVCVVDFGGAKTVSNGTFSIEFPTNNATSAIIRLTS